MCQGSKRSAALSTKQAFLQVYSKAHANPKAHANSVAHANSKAHANKKRVATYRSAMGGDRRQ